jgi:hypothetical protein
MTLVACRADDGTTADARTCLTGIDLRAGVAVVAGCAIDD